MQLSVDDIAKVVGGRVLGAGNALITGFSPIRQAEDGDLTFLSDSRYGKYLADNNASAILVNPGLDLPSVSRPVFIEVENPYVAFLAVLHHYAQIHPQHPDGIHPTAVISDDVVLGAEVDVAANAYIGERAHIGSNTVIYPGAYVGPDCELGPDCILYPNAVLREGTILGARCIIHCGAMIGSDGFGYYPVDGVHQKIPQIGIVILGDDVEVGANSAIDRATFGKTIIGSGTKIDNLVQIGHNTEVGDHTIICGNVGVAGSAHVGSHVTLAAGCGVSGHIEVGDHVTVAGMAGVTKSVSPGRVVSGFPAMEHDKERRLKASIRRVPDALRTMRALERRIEELEQRLHDRETTNDCQ